MGIAKGIGKAALWLTDKALGVTDVGFELASKAAYSIGKATVNGAGTIMAKAPGVAAASLTSHRAIQNPVMAVASGVKKVAPMLVKDELATSVYDPVKRKLIQKSGGLKLTPLGGATLLGASALSITAGNAQGFLDARQGHMDPKVHTATAPIAPQKYSRSINNGGATGDLVFDLAATRRGGTL